IATKVVPAWCFLYQFPRSDKLNNALLITPLPGLMSTFKSADGKRVAPSHKPATIKQYNKGLHPGRISGQAGEGIPRSREAIEHVGQCRPHSRTTARKVYDSC